MFKFVIDAEDKETGARAGRIITEHSEIPTPVFMPVGTQASVKALDADDITELDSRIILGNTYHLIIRPGDDRIEKAGGLHKFSSLNENCSLLTDSGGFQAFSLKENRKIKEEGIHFRNYVNGSKMIMTPESAIMSQKKIGADIIMAFDECTPHPATYKYAKDSMERTHRWMNRCLAAHNDIPSPHGYSQALFGIIQGSVFPDLRKRSAEFMSELDIPGIAIGGLSVGEETSAMYEMTAIVSEILPREKPHYLMGVGTPENLLESVSLGIDMFDCVMPTRNARNGQVFTSQGRLHYKNGSLADSFDKALDPNCSCKVCKKYSRAYLRHLYNANELTVLYLASYHNIAFYLNLMKEARQAIIDGCFSSWKKNVMENFAHD